MAGALAAGLVDRGDRASAADGHQHSSTAALSPAQAEFHDGMRKLWEDHVDWTRLAIVTFADGSDGFDATAPRLLRNQADLGDAIKPFYGEAAGDQLTALLRDHILIAVQLLEAAREARAWLRDGSIDLPSPERFLGLHRHAGDEIARPTSR